MLAEPAIFQHDVSRIFGWRVLSISERNNERLVETEEGLLDTVLCVLTKGQKERGAKHHRRPSRCSRRALGDVRMRLACTASRPSAVGGDRVPGASARSAVNVESCVSSPCSLHCEPTNQWLVEHVKTH